MKKQIIYPRFIPRLFAMTIDLMLLSIALTPIMNFIARYVFLYLFQQFFLDFSVDVNNQTALRAAMQIPEFSSYITASRFFTYTGLLFIINTIFMGVYFIFFWHKFGATPGKMLMRMKIVDSSDFSSKPSIYRLFKRFVGYVTLFIGIFRMAFSKNGQATHDKMANTIVIKN